MLIDQARLEKASSKRSWSLASVVNGPEEQALTPRDDTRSIAAKVGNEPAKEMGGRILSQHHMPADRNGVRSTWAKPSLRMRNPDPETELIGSKPQDMAFSSELDVLLDL